ncbi:solute carrier family 41 member 1-like [Anneissia japonica]|uniref:solute carrier family 41 member 1-like n=1 Tax=Anneissia japonica TaxID=1529436 RepID=UPI0014256183|nr:solute carrier family 41 member 1-like [Anneissia japonica]XP_033114566.1 solute carrier family 41 member 1-like [Anneissia japonica]
MSYPERQTHLDPSTSLRQRISKSDKAEKMVPQNNIEIESDHEEKLVNGRVKLETVDSEEEIETTLDSLLVNSKDTQTLLPIAESHIKIKDETSMTISIQIFLPFLIAGFGTVGAGMVLDIVQHWDVFEKVGEVFILVPALLGLKGNLEMTLASRLSTAANLGTIDTPKELWKMVGGNMALTQCQAIVVGFLASLAAILMGWIPDGELDFNHTLLLCASSLVTASLASGLLGSVMVAVVVLSKRYHINPDNVATPIAASLGDLTTLSLLAWISNILYKAIGKQHWLAPTIIVLFLVLVPLWAYISHHNSYTHEVLYAGWSPVITAMLISSCGGLVLDIAIRQNAGVAVFSPVINGVGGNLVAVHASRLSTSLHKLGAPGTPVEDRSRFCINPCRVFFVDGQHSKTARVLLIMVIPGQLIFLYMIAYIKAGHTSITGRVTVMYLSVAILQVAILLYTADCLIHFLWEKKKDPDNFSIPYLTALGDLLGTALLALGFYVVWEVGDKDSDIGD